MVISKLPISVYESSLTSEKECRKTSRKELTRNTLKGTCEKRPEKNLQKLSSSGHLNFLKKFTKSVFIWS